MKVNVGGGPSFDHHGWLNLDLYAAEPFELNPDCTFPIEDGEADTVYSSHTLEHLDDATASRVISESYRCLAPGGRLVIKIPDFERVLTAWKAGDATFFDDGAWNFAAVTPTWASQGTPDDLASRASMIFCGLWNEAHGDPFGSPTPDAPGAYHGPVPDAEWLADFAIKHNESPHNYAADLVSWAKVKMQWQDWRFNHRNAWSETELDALLEKHGFHAVISGASEVIAGCRDIPGISDMRDRSMYAMAWRP